MKDKDQYLKPSECKQMINIITNIQTKSRYQVEFLVLGRITWND